MNMSLICHKRYNSYHFEAIPASKGLQDFLLQLPSSLARWTREREEVFQEREAAIERKRLEAPHGSKMSSFESC